MLDSLFRFEDGGQHGNASVDGCRRASGGDISLVDDSRCVDGCNDSHELVQLVLAREVSVVVGGRKARFVWQSPNLQEMDEFR